MHVAALLSKARARHIEPRLESFTDPKIRRRTEAEWHTLELENGDLPNFGEAYANVEAFCRGLP